MMLYITRKPIFLSLQCKIYHQIITVESYIYITSFKMKGSPDLGQAVMLTDWNNCLNLIILTFVLYSTLTNRFLNVRKYRQTKI